MDHHEHRDTGAKWTQLMNRARIALLVALVAGVSIGIALLLLSNIPGAASNRASTHTGTHGHSWLPLWTTPPRDAAPTAADALARGVRAVAPTGTAPAAPGAATLLASSRDELQALALVTLDPHASSPAAARVEGALAVYWVVATSTQWRAQASLVNGNPVSAPSSCTRQLLPPREQVYATSCTGGVGSMNVAASSGVTAISYSGIWVLGPPAPASARLIVQHVRGFGDSLSLSCPSASAQSAIDAACASELSGDGASADLRLVLVLGMRDSAQTQAFARTALEDADTLLAGLIMP